MRSNETQQLSQLYLSKGGWNVIEWSGDLIHFPPYWPYSPYHTFTEPIFRRTRKWFPCPGGNFPFDRKDNEILRSCTSRASVGRQCWRRLLMEAAVDRRREPKLLAINQKFKFMHYHVWFELLPVPPPRLRGTVRFGSVYSRHLRVTFERNWTDKGWPNELIRLVVWIETCPRELYGCGMLLLRCLRYRYQSVQNRSSLCISWASLPPSILPVFGF